MRRTLVASLLVLAVFATAAPAAGDGTYKGAVKGGDSPVKVKVKNGRLKKFEASIYASCGLENFLITVAYPPVGREGETAKIANEKFKVVFQGDPTIEDDKRTVTGKFSGGKVTGAIKVEGPCSSDGTYSAKR